MEWHLDFGSCKVLKHFNSNNKRSRRTRNSPVTKPSYRDKLRIIALESSINIKATYAPISFVLTRTWLTFSLPLFFNLSLLFFITRSLFSLEGLFVRRHSVFLWQFFGWANCCVKSGQIGIFFDPYFPLFGRNVETYRVNLHIHFEYGKIRTRNKV